jgi:hypothetical protein
MAFHGRVSVSFRRLRTWLLMGVPGGLIDLLCLQSPSTGSPHPKKKPTRLSSLRRCSCYCFFCKKQIFLSLQARLSYWHSPCNYSRELRTEGRRPPFPRSG